MRKKSDVIWFYQQYILMEIGGDQTQAAWKRFKAIRLDAWEWLSYYRCVPNIPCFTYDETGYAAYDTTEPGKHFYYDAYDVVPVDNATYQYLKQLYIAKFGSWKRKDDDNPDLRHVSFFNGAAWWSADELHIEWISTKLLKVAAKDMKKNFLKAEFKREKALKKSREKVEKVRAKRKNDFEKEKEDREKALEREREKALKKEREKEEKELKKKRKNDLRKNLNHAIEVWKR